MEIPKAIGSSVYTKYGGNGVTAAVTPTNMALNVNSSPAVPGIPAGQVGLFTGVQQVISVPVVDQFGKRLGSEYNGHEVSETINGGNQAGINAALKNGSYNDPVGFYSLGSPHNIVLAGSPQENAWLQPGSPQNTVASPDTENPTIGVDVAGFSLAPTVSSSGTTAIPGDRVVTYSAGNLTVQWSAPGS